MTRRDLFGYGASPPQQVWPNGAKTAVSFVVNFEEGGERCVLEGDGTSESRLTDLAGTTAVVGDRDMEVESLFEFGARVGIWRLIRLFREREMDFTVFAVGRALEAAPAVADAALAVGAELVPHGWRWIDYQDVPEPVEREHLERCVALFERLTGRHPCGWYTGRNSPNTRRLVVEEGGFLYDSDAYNDELPYWDVGHGRPHLVVPYTLDANDGRLTAGGDFATAADFAAYLRDTFDWLHTQETDWPRMMSVGLHCRIIGRPGRMAALSAFMDHLEHQSGVWISTREAIARHWIATHPGSARMEND